MAKPPKTLATYHSADSSTHLRSSPDDTPVRGAPFSSIGRPAQETGQRPTTDVSTLSPETGLHQPIIVINMPPSGIGAVEAPSHPLSWPPHQIDQLFRIGDTGLFMSAEQKLYADRGNNELLRVEPNAQGVYQVPSPSALWPGPTLVKIPGEPRWRYERQGPDSSLEGHPVSMQRSGAATRHTLAAIAPTLAEKLTRPDANGLRYDKLKRSYVDVVEEGTVLARKNANGEYQATTASELTPSGPVLENIEGLTLWQRKPLSVESTARPQAPEDTGPGPGKRPRLNKEVEPAGPEANIDPVTSTTNPTPYLWASWGKTTKPDTVESIQIGQLHYPIVPRGLLADKLPFAFLQHPQFAPSRFEAFERMLHEAPELQPVLTYRDGNDVQKVNGANRVFDKPLAQQVADRFQHFTDQSSRVVATRLFELASDAGEINGSSIARLMQTFRHWDGKSTQGVSGVGDPLDMLPVAASSDASRRIVPLLAPESVKTLQQLNFTPPDNWTIYANKQTAKNLKALFINILDKSGYDTLTPDAVTHLDTLVFKRPNHPKVYFMKLGRVETENIAIRTPLTLELQDPLLINQMSAEMHRTLVAAHARNDVVWLIGGVQHLPTKSPSTFILRER